MNSDGIQYQLVRSRRKSIGITLKPGGVIEVRAPLWLSEAQIKRAVLAKSDWIVRKQKQMQQQAAEPDLLMDSDAYNRYFRQAKETIPKRVQFYAKKMQESYGRVVIKDQKTRWGSCSTKRNLNFNWRLIMAPKEVLDYVVVHELSHLKHMDHSVKFWERVECYMPDYRICRQWLKENGRYLSNVRPENRE